MNVPADPLSPLREEHAEHHGNHDGYACGFSAAHCWTCGEPWPCRTSRDILCTCNHVRDEHRAEGDHFCTKCDCWGFTVPRFDAASAPAPAGHGPWCVQDGHGDSAEPFVHGPDCRRDDTPAESPAPAGLDKLPRCEHGAIREPCVPCSEFKP